MCRSEQSAKDDGNRKADENPNLSAKRKLHVVPARLVGKPSTVHDGTETLLSLRCHKGDNSVTSVLKTFMDSYKLLLQNRLELRALTTGLSILGTYTSALKYRGKGSVSSVKILLRGG